VRSLYWACLLLLLASSGRGPLPAVSPIVRLLSSPFAGALPPCSVGSAFWRPRPQTAVVRKPLRPASSVSVRSRRMRFAVGCLVRVRAGARLCFLLWRARQVPPLWSFRATATALPLGLCILARVFQWSLPLRMGPHDREEKETYTASRASLCSGSCLFNAPHFSPVCQASLLPGTVFSGWVCYTTVLSPPIGGLLLYMPVQPSVLPCFFRRVPCITRIFCGVPVRMCLGCISRVDSRSLRAVLSPQMCVSPTQKASALTAGPKSLGN